MNGIDFIWNEIQYIAEVGFEKTLYKPVLV